MEKGHIRLGQVLIGRDHPITVAKGGQAADLGGQGARDAVGEDLEIEERCATCELCGECPRDAIVEDVQ